MTRFEVVWHHDALMQLAELWLESEDRARLNDAIDAIDEALTQEPDDKGEPVAEGLRRLVEVPVDVLYAVDSPSFRVDVLSCKPHRIEDL